MTQILGTNVSSPLAPNDTADTFGTHKAVYGVGGHRSVADHTARDAITTDRREEGMTVYTANDGKTWQLGSDLTTWTEFGAGGGGGSSDFIAGLAAKIFWA